MAIADTGWRRWAVALLVASTVVAAAEEETSGDYCVLSASVEYTQRGPEADVSMTIAVQSCTVATGSHVIEATIHADGADGPEKLAFPETWSRDRDGPLVIERRYPIGDDVDLLRIRIRKLKCTCGEAGVDDSADAPARQAPNS